MELGQVTELLFYDRSDAALKQETEQKDLYHELQERVARMKNILKTDSRYATLIVGAGISCSAGLPDWQQLLARLTAMLSGLDFQRDAVYRIGEPADELLFFDELEKAPAVFADSDVLEVAEYVYKVFYMQDSGEREYSLLHPAENPKDAYLKELVRRALESMITDGDFFSYERLKTKAIGKIGELAAAYFTVKQVDGKDKGNGNDRPFTRKRSIVNYNFDNLLEYCLKCQALGADYQSVIDGNWADPDKSIHIYHPHGYLPLKGTFKSDEEEEQDSKRIILAESDYYEMEQYSYSWENFVLARALQDSTCMFFGFSGNDYNFRRILKNLVLSPNKKESHFLVVTIDQMVESLFFQGENEMCRKEGLLKRIECLQKDCPENFKRCRERLYKYLALKEGYWKTKGFIPIWTTKQDLPMLLDALLK